MSATDDAKRPRTRRAILTAAAAAGAASVAAAIKTPSVANAAAGDPLIIGQTNSAGSSATRLSATSSGGAFWMTQNGSGSGVRGDSTAGHGGVFTTEAPNYYGLYAQQNAGSHGSTGAAVRAVGNSNMGVSATTAYNQGTAISGEATYVSSGGTDDKSPRGVAGTAHGDGDIIFIIVLAFPNPSAGVYGVNDYDSGSSEAAAGVWGEAYDDNSHAVRGLNWGGGDGIFAASVNGIGGYFSASNDYAVYASGDARVTGDLTVDGSIVNAAATTFRMTHPNASDKVINHTSVGSNERLNVYSGNVTTDASGKATVKLPAWLNAANSDLRYQLTTIGAQAQAWVAAEAKGGSFAIATDKANIKVSWQITGVRADDWARANPLDVVAAKPAYRGPRADPVMDAVKDYGAARVKAERKAYRAKTGI